MIVFVDHFCFREGNVYSDRVEGSGPFSRDQVREQVILPSPHAAWMFWVRPSAFKKVLQSRRFPARFLEEGSECGNVGIVANILWRPASTTGYGRRGFIPLGQP